MLLFQDNLFYSLDYKYRHFYTTYPCTPPTIIKPPTHSYNIFRSCIPT